MRSLLLAAVVLVGSAAPTAADTPGLAKGTPDLKSATALAFGPNGVLFIGDPVGAAVYAVDTGDTGRAGDAPVNVERVDAQIAGVLGVADKDVKVNDLKVNPASGNVYVAADRGQKGGPAIVRITRAGKTEAVNLKDVPCAKVALPNAFDPATSPAGRKTARYTRADSITQMGYVDGRLFVAGLANEEFASTLRAIPYPFKDADKGAGIEIFHGAHGGIETHAPIRTFTPYKVGGQDTIMAAYTCTPLVKIPVSELKAGAKVKGTTIAELGNRNNPLDMIVYTKDGKDYILMANTARGVMKIPAEGFDKAAAITARPSTDTAGVGYEKVAELKDVMQLDKLDDGRALILVKTATGLDVKTIPLP